MVVLPGVSRPWVSEGSKGRWVFFGTGRLTGTGLGEDSLLVRRFRWFFVEDLYFCLEGVA